MEKSRGIVLRSMKYGESSLILDILTDNAGLESFIVSGVRSKKASTASLYHTLQQLDIVYYPGKGDSLRRIKEARLDKHYTNLLLNVPITALGNFLIECVGKVAKQQDSSVDFHSFLSDALAYIDEQPSKCGNFHLYFLLDLCTLAGYEIENNYSPAFPYFDLATGSYMPTMLKTQGYFPTTDIGQLLSTLIGRTWEDIQLMALQRAQKYDLIELLIQYLTYHSPGFTRPKSLDIFRVVFG